MLQLLQLLQMLQMLKLLKLLIRLNSLKRLEGCVIQGLIANKAFIAFLLNNGNSSSSN